MKKEKMYIKVIMSFAFLTMFIVLSVNSTYASVNLPDLNVPGGTSMYYYSNAFQVKEPGPLKINIRMYAFNFGIQTYRFKVQLTRGSETNPSGLSTIPPVVASKDVVINGTEAPSIFLDYNLTDCNHTGPYRIRVRAINGPGKAVFSPFDPPISRKTTNNLPQFDVSRTGTLIRDIPGYMEPKIMGRWIITANWKSNCSFDINGCKLLFTLKHRGKKIAGSSGYADRATGGTKMKISHYVTQNQIGGNWELEIKGNDKEDVTNVIPQLQFISGCNK